MTTPRRQLVAVAQIAAQLEHQWDTYLATAAALAPPLLHAAGRDTGRSNTHADPTATVVLAHSGHDDIVEAITAWLAQGRWIADKVLRPVAAEGPRSALGERERHAALCADPLCGRYAVKAGWCLPHYNAAYYQTRREAQKPATTAPRHGERIDRCGNTNQPLNPAVGDASTTTVDDSTETVLGNRSPHPCAPTEGTCGRCGTTVHGMSVSHVRDLLATHHGAECPAR